MLIKCCVVLYLRYEHVHYFYGTTVMSLIRDYATHKDGDCSFEQKSHISKWLISPKMIEDYNSYIKTKPLNYAPKMYPFF